MTPLKPDLYVFMWVVWALSAHSHHQWQPIFFISSIKIATFTFQIHMHTIKVTFANNMLKITSHILVDFLFEWSSIFRWKYFSPFIFRYNLVYLVYGSHYTDLIYFNLNFSVNIFRKCSSPKSYHQLKLNVHYDVVKPAQKNQTSDYYCFQFNRSGSFLLLQTLSFLFQFSTIFHIRLNLL